MGEILTVPAYPIAYVKDFIKLCLCTLYQVAKEDKYWCLVYVFTLDILHLYIF